jgi:translation elongation factor EF-1alpha
MNQKICLELFKNNKSMGRIALRDGEETIAAGFISEFFY